MAMGWRRQRVLAQAVYGIARFRLTDGYRGMFPWSVQLQTTSICEPLCRFCPQRAISGLPHGQMDLSLFRRVVDECMGHDELVGLSLSLQNEPLSDPRLDGLVRYAAGQRRNRATVGIVTNGVKLTPPRLAELERAGLDRIQINVQASREEYEQLTRQPDWYGFQRDLSQLERCRSAVEVSVVRVKLSRRRAHPHHYAPPFGEGEVLGGQLRRLLRRALAACPIPFYQANILFNGDVIICSHDWERQVVLGNVREQSLASVWNSEHANRIRRAWLRHRERNLPSCVHCSVFRDLAVTPVGI
jgi:radical SAM protein with 4Fe4S-binding SPASM domain